MSELTNISLVELAAQIRNKQLSPVEVVRAYLESIDKLNGELNAIVTIAPDVLEQARRAEASMSSGNSIGPLHGVPLTIKDTIDTAGIRTTSGSRVKEHFVPQTDAPAVSRLKAAGAIVLGKSNTPEMAIPYETDNEIFGRTNNPYDLRLTAGGSSGGEAAAIAAGISPGGIGSDLSGSIRVPAHFCGIVGLKPSSERVPMAGHVPVAEGPLAMGASIGPMARTVADVSLLFSVLAGVPAAIPNRSDSFPDVRISWYDYDGAVPITQETKSAIHAAVAALERAGLQCNEKRLPGVELGSQLWIELFAEASASDLQSFYSASEELAGRLARRVLDANRKRKPRDPAAFEQALQQRNRLRGDLLEMLETTPLILAPVGATGAFPHDSNKVDVDGESISVFRAFSYAQAFNVFDLPAIVVRAGKTAAGLPLGVQIIGKPLSENLILTVAAMIETALGGWQPPFKH